MTKSNAERKTRSGTFANGMAPVLLLCGDRDRFFPREVVQEKADLIPDGTLIWYRGKGHLTAGSSGRVARDILAFFPIGDYRSEAS